MCTRLAATLLAALCIGLSGCASDGEVAPVSYRDSAQQMYEEGLEQLESGDYMQAIATFEAVRNRFPYASYAALAELRVGDAEFERGQYLAAIDVFKNFLKLHPSHPEADWAAFRIGESHYRAIPSDFFIFPPPSQRDTTEARAARTTLEDFLTAYPESKHVPRARELLEESLRILARHELYVGDFYASRDKWQGAASRYEYLLRTYPSVGYDAEATFKLVDALRKLEKPEEALAALQRYLDRHPDGSGVERARELMQELRGQP
ncbi:outer membrane protein assembly factor BamD [Vulgatibacter sp.]|uniref:outer membrane protein assembly factor BamD n=1 Tax=Vulgatibacter sp. TaxID=1971226 RepID=UPI003568A0D7